MGRAVRLVLAAILALSLGCASYYIRRADSAAEAGDYEAARELYLTAANEGVNGYARLQLAKIYEAGLGTEPDPAEALRWYRAAAGTGNRFAQFKTGEYLEHGLGAAVDEAAAARFYEAAARQGEALAALRLGELSLTGRGVALDPLRAQAYFEAAAKEGNVQAAFRLGQLLLQGRHVEPDPKNGIGWLLVAAHEGHALAQTALARAWRDGVEGIQVDRQLAKQWFQEAADRGNIAAQHELSSLLQTESASPQGHEWRMASAKAGYIPAQIALAELCQQRQADPTCAAYWYEEAANRGNAYAQYQMGRLAETGRGRPRDLSEARRWYAMAAEGDMLAAKQRLRALGGG